MASVADLLCTLVLSMLAFNAGFSNADLLDGKLSYYETLHPEDITQHSVAKRGASLNEVFSNQKIVSFTALGRSFRLHLRRQRNLFAKGFEATVAHGNSNSSSLVVDPADFLQGYIQGEPRDSRVRAYYEGEDLVATIWTREDVYTVEPSWRHLPKSSKYSMIAYKASDVIREKHRHPDEHAGSSFCGYVKPDHDEAAYVPPPPVSDDTTSQHKVPGERNKRQVSAYSTCPLMLVADYHFFQEVGGSSAASTAKYLIGAISRIDAIYRSTNFGSGYENMGFEIQGLIMHDTPTGVSGNNVHYNMQASSWATSDLLNAFGANSEWKNYCLAHLFTYLAFSDGVLGLGWIASSARNQAGGVCSPAAGGRYYNTAWTSLSNKYGNRLLTQESDLVTAHEFGHNWGSQHDPSTDECAPSTASGGKYVMYTYSVSGYEDNNNLFSPCSKRAMLEVLQAKATQCFTEQSTSFCGNLRVEDEEECDGGTAGRLGEDACCDEDCMFRTGAVCSDTNSLCCDQCAVATAGLVCSSAANSTASCVGDASCDGSSIDCPAASNKPDGTDCVDGGTCESGECLAFCESKGMVSCICDVVVNSCKYCCQNGTSATCTPYGPDQGLSTTNLPDGKSCVQGICELGVCKKEIRDLTDRLWNIINNLSLNAIWEFMKANIVLATIVISLIIYVPLCIIVACIDWRRDKKDKEEVEWHNKDNEKLVSSKDNKLIRPTYRRRRPVRGGTNYAGAESDASVSKVAVGPI